MLQHKATILCWTQLVNLSAAATAKNRTELSYIVKSKSPSCIPTVGPNIYAITGRHVIEVLDWFYNRWT